MARRPAGAHAPRRAAAVPRERLWHAAEAVLVSDAPTLGRVLRWRIPGTPAELPFREVFRRYPFSVLDEGDGWSISGLAGRVWSLRPRLSRARRRRRVSATGTSPDTVRVLFAHWVEDDGDDGSALVSESRVQPVDRSARWRMRALWGTVGRFERLIGGEALTAATRRATEGGRRPLGAHPISVGTPISSHRNRLEMSSGALASSRSIASRPSRKCFQPS